jgi:hypothetical protein
MHFDVVSLKTCNWKNVVTAQRPHTAAAEQSGAEFSSVEFTLCVMPPPIAGYLLFILPPPSSTDPVSAAIAQGL